MRACKPATIGAPGLVVALLAVVVSGSARAAGGGEGPDVMTLVWQGVNLIILIGVLVYFAREPIVNFFRSRHSQVKTDLDSAAGVLSEAEARLAEWQARADRLEAEIAEIKRVARERASAESERILADAETAAERIRNDAGAALDQEVARAREELRAEAATLATKLAADLLEAQVNDDDQQRLVDEFVARVESDRRVN